MRPCDIRQHCAIQHPCNRTRHELRKTDRQTARGPSRCVRPSHDTFKCSSNLDLLSRHRDLAVTPYTVISCVGHRCSYRQDARHCIHRRPACLARLHCPKQKEAVNTHPRSPRLRMQPPSPSGLPSVPWELAAVSPIFSPPPTNDQLPGGFPDSCPGSFRVWHLLPTRITRLASRPLVHLPFTSPILSSRANCGSSQRFGLRPRASRCRVLCRSSYRAQTTATTLPLTRHQISALSIVEAAC